MQKALYLNKNLILEEFWIAWIHWLFSNTMSHEKRVRGHLTVGVLHHKFDVWRLIKRLLSYSSPRGKRRQHYSMSCQQSQSVILQMEMMSELLNDITRFRQFHLGTEELVALASARNTSVWSDSSVLSEAVHEANVDRWGRRWDEICGLWGQHVLNKTASETLLYPAPFQSLNLGLRILLLF